MKSSFRPSSIHDLKAIRELLARAFGVDLDAPFVKSATMAWKYWDRRDDWTGPRSYVLERDGVIAAHAGIWPITLGVGSDAVHGVQMIDWASSRDAPGAGRAVLQKVAAMFDFAYSIGGSEITCKLLPTLGFVEYRHQWRGVRPLRPVRQILNHQNRSWKLAPRLVRNWLWAMPKVQNPYKSWKAIEIPIKEISSEIYVAKPADAVFSPRTPAFFEYLLRCPAVRFSLYSIIDGGKIRGHFAISIVRGQARVAGVWLQEPTQKAWVAAYCLTQQTAFGLNGACELVTVGSETGMGSTAAADAGFRIVPGPIVYMLDRTKKLSLSPEFQFQLSDDDAAFLDIGTASYWS